MRIYLQRSVVVRDGRMLVTNAGSDEVSLLLCALDADARGVFGWRVGAGGELDPVGSFEGLPETVAGLAAG